MSEENKSTGAVATKCLIIVYSYHHNNTAKIANEFSKVLNAQVKTPEQVIPEELQRFSFSIKKRIFFISFLRIN